MKLKRELGLFEATFYGIGVILGAGIFALIGPAAGVVGNGLWISFLVGAIVASFTGLSYAELSTMFPHAAAEYVFIDKAYGNKFLAFLISWLIVFAGIVSIATVALGFSGYFVNLVGKFFVLPIAENTFIILTALALIAILSFVNFLGIKESSRLNIVLTVIEVLGLLIVIVLGLGHFGRVNYFEVQNGIKGVLSATTLVFFAYLGFEDIANIAEETKNPKKNISKAFIYAILFTTLIYVLVAISAVSLANWQDLASSPAPLALAASKVMGEFSYIIISFAALFATLGTVLCLLVMISRMIYGMSKERSLPWQLSLVDRKTRTPWTAVIATMLFSFIFVLPSKIEIVARMASLVSFITFAIVNLSLIWMRFTLPKMKRPFKTPINIGNFPVLAFLGMVCCSLMVFQFDFTLIMFGIGIMALGTVSYFVIRKFI
jgi:APA family basic amino acid/polyamine antiporter